MNEEDERRNSIRKDNLSQHKRNKTTYRKSRSYTDIYSQISGDSDQIWKDKGAIYQRTAKHAFPSNKIDYDFLRRVLGIKSRMGSRKSTCEERFLNEELREAVLKVRGEVQHLKIEIKDANWLKTLEDLGDISGMNEDLLEALYMLRNAYKRGLFSSTPCMVGKRFFYFRSLAPA